MQIRRDYALSLGQSGPAPTSHASILTMKGRDVPSLFRIGAEVQHCLREMNAFSAAGDYVSQCGAPLRSEVRGDAIVLKFLMNLP